jgi:hypothetical protein
MAHGRKILASLAAISLIRFTANSQTSFVATFTFTDQTQSDYSIQGSGTTFSSSGGELQSSWYDPDWSYRQKIVLNKEKIAGSLAGFPVLISLTDQQNAKVFDTAREDGFDILFTDQGGNKLPHEIERFSTSSKNLDAWVNVPELSSTQNTTLYLYWGNPKAEDQELVNNAWDNSYQAVWHLDQSSANGTAGLLDSTRNHYHGTPQNFNGDANSATATAGEIVNAVHLDGSNDTIRHNLELPREQGTISHWVKPDQLRTMILYYQSDQGSSTASGIYDGFGGGNMEIHTGMNGSTWDFTYTDTGSTYTNFLGGTGTANTWAYLTATWGPNGVFLYLNDQLVSSNPNFTPGTHSSSIKNIGQHWTSSTRSWDGYIDEVRVSSVARSAEWVTTEYRNQSDPPSFYEASPIEKYTAGVDVITLTPEQAIPFSKLLSFSDQAEGKVTYQLSNDTGQNWYWFNNKQWVKTTAGKEESNSSKTLQEHIKAFPKERGKLAWRAYLDHAVIKKINIEYMALPLQTTKLSASTALPANNPLRRGVVLYINNVFHMVYGREPAFKEWEYWAGRVLKGDKKSISELKGAIEWQKIFKKTGK